MLKQTENHQILMSDWEKQKALAQVELIRQALNQFFSQEDPKANPPTT